MFTSKKYPPILRSANYWAPVLLILILVGMTMLNMRLIQSYRGYDDFAPRWMAARTWLKTGKSPYSAQMAAETQKLYEANHFTVNEFDQGRLTEPVFYVFLYLPFSALGFPLARAIWMTILELCFVLSGWLAIQLSGIKLKALETVLFCILIPLWYPFTKLILAASVVPPFIFMTLLAIRMAFQGKSSGAGILLFTCILLVPVSIPIMLFLVLYLGARRDTALIQIYLTGLVFLFVLAQILFPGWIVEWAGQFQRFHGDLSWIDTPLMRLAALVPSGQKTISIILHAASFLYLLVEWYRLGSMNERQIIWKLMLTLVILYLFNLTSHAAYLLLIFPALFMIFRYLWEKWKIVGKIVSWLMFLGLMAIYWNRYLQIRAWHYQETALIILIVPIIAFIGLQWFRWWATESPQPLVN